MKRTPPPQPHNSVRKIESLWRPGALPRAVGLHLLTVWHDAWCGIYAGQRCTCEPEVRLKWSLPQVTEN